MTRDTGGAGRGLGVDVQGTGPAVVLLHGVGMRRQVWTRQAASLARTHRVVTVDLPGHGDSPLPPPTPTLSDYAGPLLQVLDRLDVERAHVVGHSMGALVALAFALDSPSRTASVVALNGVHRRSTEQRAAVGLRLAQLREHGVASTLDATLARWFGDPVPAPLTAAAAAVRGHLLAVDPTGYARTYALFATADDAHADRLRTLRMPALFATGAHDANSTPAMSEAMAREAPLGEARIVPGAGHMMTVTHTDAVDALLAHWLGGRDTPHR